MNKCYRIVRAWPNGSLTSHSVGVESPFCVDYVPGVLTAPRVTGTKLFVYLDLYVAKPKFNLYNHTQQLWECSYEGIAEPVQQSALIIDQDMQEFWVKRALGLELPEEWGQSCDRAFLVDGVTLLKRIES